MGRDLPWRATTDPYAVWVSEIMCQQTRVATVIPFYERWMVRFPTVDALADAPEDVVLAHWQGLGYYRRAKLLHSGARQVAEFGWPKSDSDWRRIAGVGAYTAAAIASISLREPKAVVDGNVERVFARFNACDQAGSALHRTTWAWATKVLDHQNPGDWNQAVMELGALICTPKSPRCNICPLATECRAHQEGRQAYLPLSQPKSEKRQVEFHTYVPFHDGQFGIRRVPQGDWWQGLWEFERQVEPKSQTESIRNLGTIRHVVTRHAVTQHAYLWTPNVPDGYEWHTTESLAAKPMAAPQRKILRLAENFLNRLPLD